VPPSTLTAADLEEVEMCRQQLTLSEMDADDLPFLLELWHIPEVMRYADEFPRMRGWSKSDDRDTAWRLYQARRSELGNEYTQLILWLAGSRSGESFVAPLPEGYTFGRWEKPAGVRTVMGDIKLLPQHWGYGWGTEGMRRVVQWVFEHAACALFVVPPHRRNPAAERVYEKAGFVRFTGMRSWRNHRIMELTRERFKMISGRAEKE
jgi:RimJ/RimL family protein N-acetyltransferase